MPGLAGIVQADDCRAVVDAVLLALDDECALESNRRHTLIERLCSERKDELLEQDQEGAANSSNSDVIVGSDRRLQSSTSASTYAQLSAAISDGASISVTSSITVTSTLTISSGQEVEISSENGGTLSGGGSARIFSIYSGGSLKLKNLILRNGYVSFVRVDVYLRKDGANRVT